MEELTFEGFDKLNRKDLAERCTHVVSRFYPLYEGSFVLALNGKFGSGKTTFLKMWKGQLEKEEYKVVYIDAWGTDFSDDPLIAIIGSLLDGLDETSFIEKVKPAFLKALCATAFAGSSLAAYFTGLDPYGAIKAADDASKNVTLQKVGETLYQDFSFKKEAYRSLKEKLSEYVKQIKGPLIIFVDELDRVRPDYAVKFLEAIKHIFSLQGVCFVLAVDRNQMESSVRQLYGNIDFENYYRRFITREVQLPESYNIDLGKFIENETAKLFEAVKKVGATVPEGDNYKDKLVLFLKSACKFFKFSLRQVESLMRILSHFSVGGFLKLPYTEIAVLLIAISIDNRDIYERVGQEKISPKEINSYLRSIDTKYEKVRGCSSENPENELIFLLIMSLIPARPEKELSTEVCELCRKYQFPSYNRSEQSDQEIMRSLNACYGRFDIDLEGKSKWLYGLIETWRPFVEET